MTYRIDGPEVTLELAPEEIDEVIASLALTAPESELLEAFIEYRKENGLV